MSADRIRVAIIAVNYRTTTMALAFARQFDAPLPDQTESCRVIIVDNTDGSQAGELGEALRANASAAILLDGGGNLGYFGGARRGLEELRRLEWEPDWIVISNVDISFDPGRFVAALLRKDPEAVGVIGPEISSSKTRKQLNPYFVSRPPLMRMHAYKWIFRFYPTMLLYEWMARAAGRLLKPFRRRAAASVSPKEQMIYAPHGSVIIFSRTFFSRGGSLAHAPFLFGEEITVAETARALGLPVAYCSDLKVMHEEHASIGALPNRRVHRFLREAATYCADRYFPLW